MEDPRIKFETAKIAKDRGFQWSTFKFEKTGTTSENLPIGKFYKLPDGVDTNVNYCYNDEGREITPKQFSIKNTHYPRPTHYVLAKWLMDRHGVNVETHLTVISRYAHGVPYEVDCSKYPNDFYWTIDIKMHDSTWQVYSRSSKHPRTENFGTREEAMEAGLLYALQELDTIKDYIEQYKKNKIYEGN